MALLGSDENINLWLNTETRKDPIRHFWLTGDPFEGLDEHPVLNEETPSGELLVPKGMFQIYGENFDDLTIGNSQEARARLGIGDDSGRTWEVWYDVLVTRLGDTLDGNAQWLFCSEGIGVLYAYPEGKKPTGLREIGSVDLPLSGVVESLNPLP